MAEYTLWQVDAFTSEPFLGNPCGIVFDADSLSESQMQTIATHLNLSETVFLCRPTTDDADYRARIFTPRSEIPFAGHPTVAAAFSHYTTGHTNGDRAPADLKQECGIGIVPIVVGRQDGAPLFTMSMGQASHRPTGVDAKSMAAMLSIDSADVSAEPIAVCSVGLPWLIARIESLGALTSAVPDLPRIERVCRDNDAAGLTVYCDGARNAECTVHVRSFVPGLGIPEDPVCGSGNAAVAVHRFHHSMRGYAHFHYRAEQGLEIGRRGILHLTVLRGDDGAPRVSLGGAAVRIIAGTVAI